MYRISKYVNVAMLCMLSCAYADQTIAEIGEGENKHSFSVGVEANFLSRTAFNYTDVNATNANAGKYPQDSFAYTSMKIFGDYKWRGLSASVGYFGGVAYTYVGWYPFMDDLNTGIRSGKAVEFHRFLFYRAFVGYDDDNWFVRAGRFVVEDDDWLKSTAQGAEVIYKRENFLIKAYALSHLTTAFGAWVWDFVTDATPTGIYHLAGQYNYSMKNSEDSAPLLDFKIRPFIYLVPSYYVMPGFSARFSYAVSSNIKLNTYAIFTYESFLSDANKAKLLYPLVPTGENAASLYIQQGATLFNKYDVSIGFYKNFGNFNAIFGRYGNPANVSIYDGSFFASVWLNDFLAKDSQSILLNASTSFFDKRMLVAGFYRFTWNDRSIENTAGVIVSYNLTQNITFRGILAWYLDTTKAGNNARFWIPVSQVPDALRGPITNVNTPTVHDDRSYFMFNIIVRI